MASPTKAVQRPIAPPSLALCELHPAEVSGANPLTDPNLPEAEVLRLLGE